MSPAHSWLSVIAVALGKREDNLGLRQGSQAKIPQQLAAEPQGLLGLQVTCILVPAAEASGTHLLGLASLRSLFSV